MCSLDFVDCVLGFCVVQGECIEITVWLLNCILGPRLRLENVSRMLYISVQLLDCIPGFKIVFSAFHFLCLASRMLSVVRVCVLTIIEVLEQVLLTREVQPDSDVDSDRDGLTWLQRETRDSVLHVPAHKLPKQLFYTHIRRENTALRTEQDFTKIADANSLTVSALKKKKKIDKI